MIAPDKRKAIFLLHGEGMSVRQIAQRLKVSRNTVREIIQQEGQMPVRAAVPPVDPELLRELYHQCEGYGQRVWEKLHEEHGVKIKYSTLMRWLRRLGVSLPVEARCDRVPDVPGAEMQHDTSPFTITLGTERVKLQASLLYLRYSKRRYLLFYRAFTRFEMKCFLHRALRHWSYAPRLCIIDNTNLARLRGLGAEAVIVPEMEQFAKTYGFVFICHARGHADRKAGEERSFSTVETNFLPGRTFASLEDLNVQALAWSTVRMEQRPQGKAGLIPAQAFEYERTFLQQLPPSLPPPYKILDRGVDEYGYSAVEGNYYWVPGTGRGQVRILRYEQHLEIYQAGQRLRAYPLPGPEVHNQLFHPPGQPEANRRARHRPRPSDEEEKRLRALGPEVSAYIDLILATPGLQRHHHLRRLFALSERMSAELFTRSVARARHYKVTDLHTLEKIACLHLKEDQGQLPMPPVDESFRERPAYREGSLTDTPDLSQYE